MKNLLVILFGMLLLTNVYADVTDTLNDITVPNDINKKNILIDKHTHEGSNDSPNDPDLHTGPSLTPSDPNQITSPTKNATDIDKGPDAIINPSEPTVNTGAY
jgi:hypothetical protein